MADERILLVQLADIGDLVLATPAMAALRESKPQALIDLLTSDHALPIVPDGMVDRAIPFAKGEASASRALLATRNWQILLDLPRRNYDTIVFFHHFTLKAGLLKFRLIAKASRARRIVGLKNVNIGFLTDYVNDRGFGAMHEAQYWLELAGLLGADSGIRSAEVRREPYAGRLETTEGVRAGPRVVIHAGSGGYSRARRWAPARFAEVARALYSEFAAEVLLVGTEADDGAAVAKMLDFPHHDLVGKTTLPQLADVIHSSDLFIGADSGAMHVAAAVATPVLSIFGPSNYHAWRPWTPHGRSTVLTSQVECSPCSYVGGAIGARDGCPARTCMKLVSVSQVINAASAYLAGDSGPAIEIRPAPCQPAGQLRQAGMRVLGVPVDGITYAQWIELIGQWINEATSARHVCTVNPEFIMIARNDPVFFQILRRADLCVPDGVGLLWASRILGSPIPQRVTGSDGVPLIARHAAERGWRIFLLGAAEGIAAEAAGVLNRRHPALQIAGCYAGSPSEAEEDAIVALVNQSAVDILFVAYGAPEQDKWIARNLPRLQVKMAMGIGGSLDFIAGVVPRAPAWMRRYGLEWLYRLMRQPWRFRRMLRLPRFVCAVWLARNARQSPLVEASGPSQWPASPDEHERSERKA